MLGEFFEKVPALGVAAGGIATAALLFRHQLSKLNLTTTTDAAQAKLVTNLQAEAKKWQDLYDETHRLLGEQRETNALLRVQNAMMRQMLIAKGMTEAELVAIGAVHTTHPHGQ